MKPNFALSLSFDGIRLLHRAAGGWHLLGEASVSDPDLSAALAALRKAGKAVKTGKLRTKLIIPDEQIRYLNIDTAGMDDAARRDAARNALDGATPYPVDALAFDISPDGDSTHVAAVARETLLEAEAFAFEHGFNPVSFVAAAHGAEFLGEPFFGPTAHARTLLPPGTEVEADGVRVVIVEKPAEAAPPEQQPARQPADAVTDQGPQPAQDDAPSDVAEMEHAKPEPVAMEETPTPAAANASDASDPADKSVSAGTLSIDATPLSDIVALAPAPSVAEAGITEPEVAPPPAPEAASAAPSLLGFATRRRQDPSSNVTPTRLGGASRFTPTQRTTPPVAAPDPSAPKEAPPPLNLTAPPRSAADSLRRPSEPGVATSHTPPLTAEPDNARAGGFLSRRKQPKAPQVPTRKPAAVTAPQPGNDSQSDLETERMTVFGARGDGAVRGKPRYLGLILMAVLLVFLAGVAAWAAVFLDDGLAGLFPARERTLASTLPDDTLASLAEEVGATTELDPEAVADGVTLAALNDGPGDDVLSAEDAAVLDALRDPLPDPIAPEELDAAALEARYAVTGVWPKAPDIEAPAGPVDIDNLYVTGIDPVSPALDAVALPSVASFRTDGQLALVTSPAAAGTSFARGADGRVIPTVAGALSPGGFTVFLGRPPAEPPAILAKLETGEDLVANPSTLTQVRPQIRPTDLVEQNERATLGGLSRSELAGLRPRLRPQAPQEADALQRAGVEDAPVSALATATSRRPERRPDNFARIVARATPVAPAPVTASAPVAAAAPAAAPAPQRTASVAPRTVTPSIPSRASVTREATVRHALNLRRVNLIGVYGTPSNRRALVRLANGRYKKVEVGDRFDGGRVSAIGDGELRYQKGGRNLVLKMPQG